MIPRSLLGVIVWSVAGCCPAAPAPVPSPGVEAAYRAAEAGEALPAGTIVGYVGRLAGEGFQPAPGVRVTVVGSEHGASTDGGGYFRLEGVAEGPLQLEAASPGHHAFRLTGRLMGGVGLPRANLPLVPASTGMTTVAGVVTDPRGAALPAGTVHLVDAVSREGAGGNARQTADAHGFFVARLEGVKHSGAGSLTAYGQTPGGVRVESTAVQALSLTAASSLAIQAETQSFLPARSPRLVRREGDVFTLTARDVPGRLDELKVRLETPDGAWDAVPDRLATDEVVVTLPGAPASGTLRLLTLGLVAPSAFETDVAF